MSPRPLGNAGGPQSQNLDNATDSGVYSAAQIAELRRLATLTAAEQVRARATTPPAPAPQPQQQLVYAQRPPSEEEFIS